MTIRPRDKVALAVVLALVLVFGFFKFALAPERHQAAGLDAQIATAQDTLGQAEQKYAAGRAAAVTLQSSGTAWAAANLAVPESADIPALLRLLQHSAEAAHVSMQSISLSGGDTASTTPTVPASADGPTAIQLSLTFGGGYQALNRLVGHLDGLVVTTGHGVRASGPLIGITNVSLSGTAPKLTVQLTASIYQHAQASTVVGSTSEGTS